MPLRAVAWSGSQFVAVGYQGVIQTSADGHTWIERESGTLRTLNAVAWCDSVFVAVGERGTILISDDGITWTNRSVSINNHFTAVASTDRQIVTVGSGGIYYMSLTGGRIWLHLSSFTSEYLTDIAWHGSRWVACSKAGSIFYSSDGSSWIEILTDAPDDAGFQSLVCTSYGFYVAATYRDTASSNVLTGLWKSPDGIHWDHNVTFIGHVVHDLAWTGSEIVAVSAHVPYGGRYSGGILSTADGQYWVDQPCDAPLDLLGVTAGANQIVAVGYSGYILSGGHARYMTIETGGSTINGVVWNGSRFVAVTEVGTVMTSATGQDWTEKLANGVTSFAQLLYSGERYIGFSMTRPMRIYYSDDALNWTQAANPVDFLFGDAVWANGKFVIVGDQGKVVLSPDGASWAVGYVGDSVSLEVVTHNGSEFVALGGQQVFTSADAIAWESASLNVPGTPYFSRIAWSGERYAAIAYLADTIGRSGQKILISDDGVTWQDVGAPVSAQLLGIKWTGTGYIAFGAEGIILSSTDGSVWTVLETGTDSYLIDLAISPDRLVVVGSSRAVLVSP
jgi:hypothetical protein